MIERVAFDAGGVAPVGGPRMPAEAFLHPVPLLIGPFTGERL
ncbi:hypothetical protein [Streptosporangium sp. NPDC000396]